MAKPSQLNEIDEARRVLGMIECVSNKEEYKKLFNISNKDIEEYREIVDNRKKISFNFNESHSDI